VLIRLVSALRPRLVADEATDASSAASDVDEDSLTEPERWPSEVWP